jgi:hypothetical protein
LGEAHWETEENRMKVGFASRLIREETILECLTKLPRRKLERINKMDKIREEASS